MTAFNDKRDPAWEENLASLPTGKPTESASGFLSELTPSTPVCTVYLKSGRIERTCLGQIAYFAHDNNSGLFEHLEGCRLFLNPLEAEEAARALALREKARAAISALTDAEVEILVSAWEKHPHTKRAMDESDIPF